jgi:prepilin signal peptidase PulO-like enzyme (type II secretory pathway)
VDILELALHLGLLAVLVVASITDLRERWVPNGLFFPALSLTLSCLPLRDGWQEMVLAAMILAVAFVTPSLLPRYRGRWVIGGGDVKLVILLGLVLGMPAIAVVCIAAVLLGVVALLKHNVRLGTAIPLVPFLTAGTLLWWGMQAAARWAAG